jgi:hypothetical protein
MYEASGHLRNPSFLYLVPPPSIMVLSRRGSGSVTLPTGQTLAFHTRTHDEEDLPHATKKYIFLMSHLPIVQPIALTGQWQTI